MNASNALGRAASCLEHFAAGLCLTLVAAAFFCAAEAQVTASAAPPAAITTQA